MQNKRNRSFFWHVLSPDSAQFKRGTGMLEMFSRFVTVGLGMFARFCMLFSNLHGTTLFAFLACALFQPNLNKQTNGSWCEARQSCGTLQLMSNANKTNGSWCEAQSFGSACRLREFFWCSLDVKQTKQTAVDVKHNSHVKHRTVDVDFGFCVQARRGNSLQRCHNTCSDARHQRCLKGKLQVTRQLKPLRFSAWPNSFLFRVCVRVETVSVINRLIAP